MKHVRKPLSKSLLQEVKAAEAQKPEKDQNRDAEDEKDGDTVKEEPKEKEVPSKDAKAENRDWKRNGTCRSKPSEVSHALLVLDERWLEWLDSKLALLINRNGVDPRDYSGKSYDVYVCSSVHASPILLTRASQGVE